MWNARQALPSIRTAAAAPLRTVVNRREGREHYDRDEIERALGAAVLGVLREDRKAARRAVELQAPMSAAGGRAAPDLRAVVGAFEARTAGRERTVSAQPVGAPLAVEP